MMSNNMIPQSIDLIVTFFTIFAISVFALIIVIFLLQFCYYLTKHAEDDVDEVIIQNISILKSPM